MQSKAIKRLLLAAAIIVISLVFDQVTKQMAYLELPRGPRFSYLDDMVRLQYAENAGAAFSIGADLPENVRWMIFGVGQGIFLIVLAGYLIRHRDQSFMQFYGFTLILGGGMGNFIDRIFRDGVVVDFLNVGIGQIRTAIFNIADVAITIGLIFLIYGMVQQSRQEKQERLLAQQQAAARTDVGGELSPD